TIPANPALSDNKSDTSLGLPEIFSNNVSDSDSSTTPSDLDSSESESDDKSNDRRYSVTSDRVLAIVIIEKKLSLKKRLKASIFIKDIAKFARLGYRIKRGSKITSFIEVAKLYYLRYGVLKDSSYINDIPRVRALEDTK
ncbi:hypothetical protein N7462_010903, partial [Penicillium macrosclerotiorum]|uniref:uncharacterized protein n=1 Tax=Penicillium macrosclerotiorum TaxID=303699 RepID=UPI0025487545